MPELTIPSFDGSEIPAVLAAPETGRGPGLIVVTGGPEAEALGRKTCERFAAQGYLAVWPDVLGAATDVAAVDKEAVVRTLLSCLGFVRKMDACAGKVGSVGFGLGGHFAYLLAARSDIDATVVFSPESLEKSLTETYDIITPLLLHVGSAEPLMAGLTRARFLRSVERNEKITVHTYEGAGPLFALEGSARYDPEAAGLAAERTAAFLDDRLKV